MGFGWAEEVLRCCLCSVGPKRFFVAVLIALVVGNLYFNAAFFVRQGTSFFHGEDSLEHKINHFYELTANTIDNEPLKFDQFHGKVKISILNVNISFCLNVYNNR